MSIVTIVTSVNSIHSGFSGSRLRLVTEVPMMASSCRFSMDAIDMLFSEKLRTLRDKKGLSEAKLAEASGLTFASVHMYGLGRRKPSFAAVVKMAKALGVTCQAFADCDDLKAEERPASKPKKTFKRKK